MIELEYDPQTEAKEMTSNEVFGQLQIVDFKIIHEWKT